jgi:hypothetical protein
VQVTDPGFTTVGSWPESAAIGPDGAPTRYSSSTGASASWTFVADEAGIYRAEAAIPDVANSEPGSIYTFAGGSGGPTTTTVAMPSPPRTVRRLGREMVVTMISLDRVVRSGGRRRPGQ